jgi:hypothetical protein
MNGQHRGDDSCARIVHPKRLAPRQAKPARATPAAQDRARNAGRTTLAARTTGGVGERLSLIQASWAGQA